MVPLETLVFDPSDQYSKTSDVMHNDIKVGVIGGKAEERAFGTGTGKAFHLKKLLKLVSSGVAVHHLDRSLPQGPHW